MVSVENTLPLEARLKALLTLRDTGSAPFDAWRREPAVADLRWSAGGLTSTLRVSLEASLREFLTTADPATGLASDYLLKALVLAVLDDV